MRKRILAMKSLKQYQKPKIRTSLKVPLKKLPFFLENPVVSKNGAKFYNSLNSTQRLLLFDFLLQLISKICEDLEFKSVLNLFLLVLTITVSCVFKLGLLVIIYSQEGMVSIEYLNLHSKQTTIMDCSC